MENELEKFEAVARRAHRFSEAREPSPLSEHAFEQRNIDARLPAIVMQLFDNGHYAQATFEAYKFLDKEIQRHASSGKTGFALMMDALGSTSPAVRLNPMTTASQLDEQKGHAFLFAGSILGIRNPRGHEYNLQDDVDLCLDHLSLASLLLRKLSDAGYK
jgi:uncharacterized protein (TIGR02391 family)